MAQMLARGIRAVRSISGLYVKVNRRMMGVDERNEWLYRRMMGVGERNELLFSEGEW